MRKWTTKWLCGAVSVVVLLGLASASFSLPAPMMLARTVVDIPNQGESITRATPICGAVANFSFSVTTDATTTSVIPLGGMIPWRVVNESGASATLTFYDALTVDGTALTTYDQDSVAVAAITLGDDCSQELSSGLAGCTCLVIKGGSAASGFTLVCRR
jgi:hypothetical protein